MEKERAKAITSFLLDVASEELMQDNFKDLFLKLKQAFSKLTNNDPFKNILSSYELSHVAFWQDYFDTVGIDIDWRDLYYYACVLSARPEGNQYINISWYDYITEETFISRRLLEEFKNIKLTICINQARSYGKHSFPICRIEEGLTYNDFDKVKLFCGYGSGGPFKLCLPSSFTGKISFIKLLNLNSLKTKDFEGFSKEWKIQIKGVERPEGLESKFEIPSYELELMKDGIIFK